MADAPDSSGNEYSQDLATSEDGSTLDIDADVGAESLSDLETILARAAQAIAEADDEDIAEDEDDEEEEDEDDDDTCT